MEPIRVLHVIGVMDRGGAETLIMNLYRAIDRTKVQFDFVESNTGTAVFDNEILEMGGRIYHSPKFSAKNIAAYMRWWKEFFRVHKNEYEVVHGHLGSTAAIYLGIAKKHGLYTVAHSHGTNAKMSPKIAAYHVISYPTRFIADHFFACSMQAGIDRYGKRTAASDKTEVLNNAIDTDKFRFNPAAADQVRKELGISNETLVIGHVGRFVEAKNHNFLIDVFKAIHDKNPDSVLVMVGDGGLRPGIEDKVRSEGLNDSVCFAGLKSNVYDYMSAMDVLVFPSIYEGLPVTLVEAQASGLPCLISDRIPKDAYLVPELIQVLSLDENTEKWADAAINMKTDQDRQIYTQKVKEAGFDSAENARKLMNFYLEKSAEVKHSRGQNV